MNVNVQHQRNSFRLSRMHAKCSTSSISLSASPCYRFGSVSHDTQLCLWDLSEDVLKGPPMGSRHGTHRLNSTASMGGGDPNAVFYPSGNRSMSNSPSDPLQFVPSKFANVDNHCHSAGTGQNVPPATVPGPQPPDSAPHPTTRSMNPLSRHRKAFSLTGRSNKHAAGSVDTDKSGTLTSTGGRGSAPGGTLQHGNSAPGSEVKKSIGTTICPRMEDVHTIEPLVTKKIAHERLTCLIFREDCFVTACQEGFVCTWARPGKAVSVLRL